MLFPAMLCKMGFAVLLGECQGPQLPQGGVGVGGAGLYKHHRDRPSLQASL